VWPNRQLGIGSTFRSLASNQGGRRKVGQRYSQVTCPSMRAVTFGGDDDLELVAHGDDGPVGVKQVAGAGFGCTISRGGR
jgi:hypothetical protein